MLKLSSLNFTDLLGNEKRQNIFAFLLVCLLFVFSAVSTYGRDITIDEYSHYKYGKNILNGDPSRFSDSKMPVSAWNAFPGKIAEHLPEGFLKTYLSKFITARLMTTIFSALTAYMVFVWARRLYGFIPALLSLGLYGLDPNIIAHSQLVTTDIYLMGMILISSYWFWRFAVSKSWRDCLIFSIIMGVTQLMKYPALALYPLFAIILLLRDWPVIRDALRTHAWRGVLKVGAKYFMYMLMVISISILIINIGFLFSGTFTPFNEYKFRSTQFQELQQKISIVVPTPYPYLEGVDWIIQREDTGAGYGRIYLFGTLQDKGFPGYFLFATLFKTPVATQLFMWMALIAYFFNRQKRKTLLQNEIFLLLPALFFTIYFNFFYNVQVGFRHFLVVFPPLFVFSASLLTGWAGFRKWQKIAVVGLFGYLLVSVLSYFPYYIPYFNELVWDKTQTYKILADSNLDWGQSKTDLNRYFASHPDARYAPITPESGHLIVSANHLVGIMTDPDRFAWLRENFKPVDTLAYYYYIYDISDEEIEDLCENTDYCE